MGRHERRAAAAQAQKTRARQPDAVNTITATLTPLGQGDYLIEALGVTIQSRFPENRMCKALMMAGFSGKLQVFGPSLKDPAITIHRSTCSIEGHGRRRMSEGDGGIRWRPWDDKTLAPLSDAAAKLSAQRNEANFGVAGTKL